MDVSRLDEIKGIKNEQVAKTKGKDFKNLSSSEKDELLETLCKIFGLI